MTQDLHIFDNSDLLAHAAAETFTRVAAEAMADRGRFVVALSGGSTPKALFSLLASPAYRSQIEWPAAHIFWGDERLVPPGDSGSNYRQARELLLSQVPVPDSQVYRVRGELPAPDAVENYAGLLRAAAASEQAWPRFDLVLLGLGADGHTASLFPGSAALQEQTKPVVAVTAEYAGRPAQRITLTPPVFNDARRVLFLVTGADKAATLAAVLNAPKNVQKWPAQAIQPVAGAITWYVDRLAAARLDPH